jgi:hypothetical protein
MEIEAGPAEVAILWTLLKLLLYSKIESGTNSLHKLDPKQRLQVLRSNFVVRLTDRILYTRLDLDEATAVPLFKHQEITVLNNWQQNASW